MTFRLARDILKICYVYKWNQVNDTDPWRIVMQALESSNVPSPLVLTDQQRNVLEALQSKETKKHPLSQWYLGALYALDNQYNPDNPDRISQAAHSLRELLEKFPLVVQESDVQIGTIDFKGMRRGINDRILKDKKHYSEGWKGKQINTHLDKTLRKIETYFELNKQPNRRERIQQSVATIDPMVNSLDSEIRERKRDQLHRLWKRLERFAHHNNNPDVEEFSNCLKELENTIFDLLAPITAQDQKEIQTILKAPDRSENDIERMFSLIERRGANFVFFFTQISEKTDITWLPFLEKKGYFTHPPETQLTDDGYAIYPFWWPIRYLAKISSQVPDEAIELVLQLPKIDNPRVYDGILDIALQLHGEQSEKLKHKILEYTGIDYQFLPHKYTELLAYWTAENQTSVALELLQVLVAFTAKPQLTDQNTLPNPLSRLDLWDYRDLISEGVYPLAKKEPYQVSRILMDTTANMIRLRTHPVDRDKEEDQSEFWCQQLHESDSDYSDPEETLVHTLTFACREVFEKLPDLIEDLNKILQNQHWKIFKRLRHYLYAQYPNEKTKPWIRESILGRKDYHQSEHSYEFQQMIREACNHFKETLLTKEERTRIFNAIFSGPSKEDFRERMGESFTEEDFHEHQRDFHRRQFTPFAAVLFGEYKTYFQELARASNEEISDEDYPPFKSKSGWVSNRSPYSSEDLAILPNKVLLNYINDWEEEDKLYKNDGFININIEALAGEFQTVFKESIIPDANKLRFWMENREKVERPIYIRAMIEAMKVDVKTKNFNKLDEWLAFSEWVLTHPDREQNEGYRRSDESRENPNWSNSRRAVGDFIGVCLEKEVDIPIIAREQLAKLLETICTQYDWPLDENHPKVMNEYDPLTKGINNTRSRALQELVNFGVWLRRHDSECDVPEVTTILEKRFSPETEHSLTLPEYAILGRSFYYIFSLDTAWATKHKSDFFPQSKLPEWAAAFRSFVLCNQACKPIFKILKDDFNFALQHLSDIKNRNQGGHEPITVLGERLFHYYLLDMFPLEGQESLLERFYQQTKKKREHWANLFNHIGHRLWNTGKHLNQNTEDRVRKFCDWRLKFEEPTELQYFTTWLQVECLDTEWRLRAYSKVLDVCEVEDWGFHFKTLCEMLPNHTAKVVECFFKLTERVKKDNFYIQTKEAKTILKAGLESNDEKVRRYAADARENLLKMGRFVLPDLED